MVKMYSEGLSGETNQSVFRVGLLGTAMAVQLLGVVFHARDLTQAVASLT